MSEIHRSYLPDEIYMNSSLRHTFGELSPTRPTFSLYSNPEDQETGVVERYSKQNREHVLIFSKQGPVFEQHLDLRQAGVKVLDEEICEDLIALPVPRGSRSLRAIAGLVERNTDQYAVIFELFGEQLRLIGDAELGAPAGNWLDRFGFVPDTNSWAGGRVFILPPYNLGEPADDVMLTVGEQLLDSTNVSEKTASTLVWRARNGWNRG